MKRKTLPPLLALCVSMFLLCGCMFESYRPVVEYDLPTEGAVKTATVFAVQEFRNSSTAGSRLQFRELSGKVIRDPYNLWALPPGQLLPLALNRMLSAEQGGGSSLSISGTVEEFEVDMAKKRFCLAGSWTPEGGVSRRFYFSVAMNDFSPEETVRAAAAAARELAEQIGGEARPAGSVK